MRPALVILGTLGALALAACGDGERALSSAILITLDTTRADALSCYGNARATTPALDRLAAEGVLFENAHTVTALTLPAHASMLTGLVPLRHGLRDNGVGALPPAARTVAEAAAEAGLDTAAFVSSIVLDDVFGLAQGFTVFDAPSARTAKEKSHGAERPAPETLSAARAWLAGRDGARPFFLWIHLYDPHHPYAPPAPFAGEFADDPYLGEVAGMDHALGELLDGLRADGTLARTFVLVLADHGEAFGEHGEVTHGTFCYEPTLRIPMIARWPDGSRERSPGERSREPVGAVDVAPTLVEALGLAPLGDSDGTSFYRASVPAERGLYFESYYGFLTYGWSPLAGWLDARGKYLHSSTPELYDLAADPNEVHDLAAERAGELERYRAAIAALAAEPVLVRDERGADPATLAQVRALGYAGGGEDGAELPHPLAPSALPSPRSQAVFLAQHARAMELVATGRAEEAAAIYAEVLRATPTNSFAREELAGLTLTAGRAEEAVALYQELVRTSPPRGRTQFELGLALRQARRPEEAVAAFRRAVELADGRKRYLDALCETLEAIGRAGEATDLRMRYARREEAR